MIQDRILQLAYKSFKSLGVKAVTIDYLAAQLGISKKTFYQYYENKDVLVDSMVTFEMNKSTEECIKAFEDSENAIEEIFISMLYANQDIQDLNPIFVHDLKKFHAPIYEKFMSHFDTMYGKVISNNIERGVSEGLYRQGLNIEVLTKYRVTSLFLVFDQHVFPKERFNILDVTHVILENFLFGIATKDGFNKIQEYKQKYNNVI